MLPSPQAPAVNTYLSSTGPQDLGHCCLCCRIGTEHEKLGFRLADNSRISYDEIEKVGVPASGSRAPIIAAS